jgi:hypothetical protein
MTTPSGSNLPGAAAGAYVAGRLTEEQTDEPIATDAARDDDGVPVGRADAEEDARRSGADPDDV